MPKFKVGDLVVTHSPKIISKSFKGIVGVIEEVGSDGVYKIRYNSDPQWGYEDKDSLELASETNTVINSDGGPSDYYDFPDTWKTWNDLADHKAKTQWKEYAFHLGNIGKALYRWGNKSGTSIEYDARKIVYSGLRILMMIKGRKVVTEYLEELLQDEQFKELDNV